MKRILNFIMFFLILAFSLLLESNALQVQPNEAINYLQSTKAETIVLASNGLWGSEIYSNQDKESLNYSGENPFLLSIVSNKKSFNKNIILLKECFICNLSTNKQKTQKIRAP